MFNKKKIRNVFLLFFVMIFFFCGCKSSTINSSVDNIQTKSTLFTQGERITLLNCIDFKLPQGYIHNEETGEFSYISDDIDIYVWGVQDIASLFESEEMLGMLTSSTTSLDDIDALMYTYMVDALYDIYFENININNDKRDVKFIKGDDKKSEFFIISNLIDEDTNSLYSIGFLFEDSTNSIVSIVVRTSSDCKYLKDDFYNEINVNKNIFFPESYKTELLIAFPEEKQSINLILKEDGNYYTEDGKKVIIDEYGEIHIQE